MKIVSGSLNAKLQTMFFKRLKKASWLKNVLLDIVVPSIKILKKKHYIERFRKDKISRNIFNMISFVYT